MRLNIATVCIAASVGALAANRIDDVKTVQLLLNLNRPSPLRTLGVDGSAGRATIDAIFEFQQRVMELSEPDARVDPNGKTLMELKKAIPATFSAAHLQGIALDANATLIIRYYAPLQRHMTRHRINTPLRQAHFLAQVCHESGPLSRPPARRFSGQPPQINAGRYNWHDRARRAPPSRGRPPSLAP